MKEFIYLFCFCNSFLLLQSQTITTVAGNGEVGNTGDGDAAVAAQFNLPYGLGKDAAGDLYVGEFYNYKLRKVATNGLISSIAGTGTQGYSNDGAPATIANISFPSGIAVKDKAVYFADYGNGRIRKIDSLGIITTIAGTGNPGNSGDGGPATSAKINTPSGLAIDASGNIYFTDRNSNVVRKINTSGIISTIAGTGSQGFSGDQGPANAAKLTLPHGITVDASGNIYIADTGNNRIRKINSGGVISTIAGNGTAGFSADSVQANTSQINQPHGVAVDAVGNVYIADHGNNRIRKVNTSGMITTLAGLGARGYSGDDGPASEAAIGGPIGIVCTPIGEVYFVDSFNHRVRLIK